MAEKLFDIAKSKIPFTFNGKTFSINGDPDKRLGDFNIQNNSTIYAIVRSKGGE